VRANGDNGYDHSCLCECTECAIKQTVYGHQDFVLRLRVG
jgi:hypothetical protein